MLVFPIQENFTAGEVTPLANAKVKLEQYDNALATCENFIVRLHGPISKRPGFRLGGEVKDSTKNTRLIPFIFSATQTYQIELGDQTARFWYTDVADNFPKPLGGASPTEASPVPPWAHTDLKKLKYVQSADVIYFAHPSYAPNKLVRLSASDWRFLKVNFNAPASANIDWVMPSTTATPYKMKITMVVTSGVNVLGAQTLELPSNENVVGTVATFTKGAGSPTFTSADVGKYIAEVTSGSGIAQIVSVTSTTVVEAEVLVPFTNITMAISGWIKGTQFFATLSLGSGDNFMVGDTGRLIVEAPGIGTGRALITEKGTSGTGWNGLSVKVDVLDWFTTAAHNAGINTPNWRLRGSPSGEAVTQKTDYASSWVPGGIQPKGKPIRVNNSVNCFRAGVYRWDVTTDPSNPFLTGGDEGKLILINGGMVRITQLADKSTAKGIIVSLFDFKNIVSEYKSVSGTTYKNVFGTTSNWSLETPAWSATSGFPTGLGFHEDRLYFCSTAYFPLTIWGSVVADYENFAGGSKDDDSIKVGLNARQINKIYWLESLRNLVGGTMAASWKLGSADGDSSPMTPSNIYARMQQNVGSADIQPVVAQGAVIYVQASGTRLIEMAYATADDAYGGRDLSLLSEHLTRDGIAALAYQEQPGSLVWCGLNNNGQANTLVAMTYLPAHKVYGWHKHLSGTGIFESESVIPGIRKDSASNSYQWVDELWVVVKRGSTRYVERLDPISDNISTFTSQTVGDPMFLDNAVSWKKAAGSANIHATTNEWAPATPLPCHKLNHLLGQTVTVIYKTTATPYQYKVTTAVVINTGTFSTHPGFTLPESAIEAHIGLPYTATALTLRPEINTQKGTSQGKIKRDVKIGFRVLNSGPFKFGPSTTSADLKTTQAQDKVSETMSVKNSWVAPFTGDVEVDFHGGYTKNLQVAIVSSDPYPLTLQGIFTDMYLED